MDVLCVKNIYFIKSAAISLFILIFAKYLSGLIVKKTNSKQGKKVSFTLSQRDYAALAFMAKAEGTTKAVAMRKVLHDALQEYAKNVEKKETKNQLGLFDTLQIDIFNNTSRIEDENK